MSGIYKEIQKRFGESVENYIMASRCAQGLADLSTCTIEEKENILRSWAFFETDVVAKSNARRNRHKVDDDGKRVRTKTMGEKSKDATKTQEEQDTESVKAAERANRRESLLQLFRGRASSSPPPRRTMPDSALSDEYEHAIRHSVLATSQGNEAEDEMIERALRASMTELRNAKAAGEEEERAYDLAVEASIREAERVIEEKKREHDERSAVSKDEKSNYYVHQPQPQPPAYSVDQPDQKQPRRPPALPPRSPMPIPTDHDIDLQNALNESQRSYDDSLQREQREKEELDIIIEHVKRQSLAEAEQQRRQQEQQQREEAKQEEAMES
jgi:hypothetical protein